MLSDRIARLAVDVPKQFRANIPAAAKELDAAVYLTLDTPGTRDNPAPPGSPPHNVTGALLAGSGARPEPDGIAIYTTPVGRFQQQGTRRMAARPWVAAAVALARDSVRAALFDFRR